MYIFIFNFNITVYYFYTLRHWSLLSPWPYTYCPLTQIVSYYVTKLNIVCFGVTVKCSLQAHIFELLVPSQWGCFGRLWNHQGLESSWRNVLLGVTLEVSEPTLHPHCFLIAYTMCPTSSASCCWNFTTIADVSSPTVSPGKRPLPWLPSVAFERRQQGRK